MNIVKKIGSMIGNTTSQSHDDRLPYPHVDLYYWAPDSGPHNFGDFLSSIVVEKVLARHDLALSFEAARSQRMLAVGSILHFAEQGNTIWGTGMNARPKEKDYKFSSLDVRSVRGPLTREFLMKRGIEVPEIYGDPVLLLPELFPTRFKATQELDHLVVGHLLDIDQFPTSGNFLSPLTSWSKCVDTICKAKFVVSSSLHGIIVAEAFGIGACYLRLSEREPMLKYHDYYLGTGRESFNIATSVEQAMEMGPTAKPVLDTAKILNAFPIDLWT